MDDRPETPDTAGPPTPEGLRRYYEIMREADLAELEIREGDFFIKLSRGDSVPAPVVSSALPASAAGNGKRVEAATAPPPTVTSPLAGVFYRAPGPTSAPFVKEGDTVAYGDLLCIVEAMKVMNEIRSDKPGKIKKILAENGKPVSAGQDLFLFDPS